MSVARSPGRAEHNDAIGAYRAAMQLSPNKEVRTRRTAAFVPSPFSAEHISRDCIFVFTPSPHRCVRSPTQQLVCPPAGSGLLHGGNRSARRRSGPKLGRRVLPRNPHSTYRPKLFCVSWALTLSSGGRRRPRSLLQRNELPAVCDRRRPPIRGAAGGVGCAASLPVVQAVRPSLGSGPDGQGMTSSPGTQTQDTSLGVLYELVCRLLSSGGHREGHTRCARWAAS